MLFEYIEKQEWFSTSPNTGNDFYHSVSFGRDKLLKIGFTFEIHCFMEYFCYTLHFYSAKVLFLWFPTNIWRPFFLSSMSSVCQFLFTLHLQRLRQNSINSVRLPCLFGSWTELIVFLPLFSSSLQGIVCKHPPSFCVCNAKIMRTSICDALYRAMLRVANGGTEERRRIQKSFCYLTFNIQSMTFSLWIPSILEVS